MGAQGWAGQSESMTYLEVTRPQCDTPAQSPLTRNTRPERMQCLALLFNEFQSSTFQAGAAPTARFTHAQLPSILRGPRLPVSRLLSLRPWPPTEDVARDGMD